MDLFDLKQACRKAGFAQRKLAHERGFEADANAQLTNFLKQVEDDKIIALYMPIRTEVSPLPTMERLARRGRKLCLPVVVGEAKPLEFRRYHPDDPLVEGVFGAAIPKEGAVMVPDIIVAPLVAFDAYGYRLGYGGGYYDRSFAQISAQKDILAVGYAYSDQEVMMVPRESTDFQLNAVITEKGALTF